MNLLDKWSCMMHDCMSSFLIFVDVIKISFSTVKYWPCNLIYDVNSRHQGASLLQVSICTMSEYCGKGSHVFIFLLIHPLTTYNRTYVINHSLLILRYFNTIKSSRVYLSIDSKLLSDFNLEPENKAIASFWDYHDPTNLIKVSPCFKGRETYIEFVFTNANDVVLVSLLVTLSNFHAMALVFPLLTLNA